MGFQTVSSMHEFKFATQVLHEGIEDRAVFCGLGKSQAMAFHRALPVLLGLGNHLPFLPR